MVFDTECMLSDPVAMTDRCEKEKEESVRQRHLHVDRRFAKIEDRDDLRAAGKIQDLLPHITEAEALIALDLCNNDEKVTAKKLQSYDFLLQIRRKVCQKIRPLNEPCDQKLRSPTADRNSCKAAASNREGNVDVDMSGWSEVISAICLPTCSVVLVLRYCILAIGAEACMGAERRDAELICVLLPRAHRQAQMFLSVRRVRCPKLTLLISDAEEQVHGRW
eukprot:3061643-Rhodomonas_salina.3